MGNQKGSVLVVVVITILSIAVAGLGGFVVYDKVIDKKESKVEEKTANNKSDTNEANEQTTEDKYQTYVDNMYKNNECKLNRFVEIYDPNANINDSYEFDIGKEGKLYIKFFPERSQNSNLYNKYVEYDNKSEYLGCNENQEFDRRAYYTGIDGVADIIIADETNGPYQSIFIIKKDKSIYKLDYKFYETTDINFNELKIGDKKVKNLVKVDLAVDQTPYQRYIDIDGNLIK